MIPRRALLSAIPALICAPAIVRVSSLMPVKVLPLDVEVISPGDGYTAPPMWIIVRGIGVDGRSFEQRFEFEGGAHHAVTGELSMLTSVEVG